MNIIVYLIIVLLAVEPIRLIELGINDLTNSTIDLVSKTLIYRALLGKYATTWVRRWRSCFVIGHHCVFSLPS